MANAILALLVTAALPSGASFSVDPGASTIRYTVVHKLHRVEGVTHDMEARAVVKDDGSVLVMVRVPMASFRSGDGNRDEHMVEAVDAGKFPFVVLKGVVHLGPAREASASPVTLDGEVALHGVTSAVKVPTTLTVEPGGAVRARGAFDVSLGAHGVQRPSLLFVKIDDGCHLDFDLSMREAR